MKYKILVMPARELRLDDTRPRYYAPDDRDDPGRPSLRAAFERDMNRVGDALGYGFHTQPPPWTHGQLAFVAQAVPENDAEVVSGASFTGPKGSDAPLPDGIAATPAPRPPSVRLDSSSGENPKARFGALKLPLHLVPPVLNVAASRTLGDGVAKGYGPYNWRTTKVTASTYIGAVERHLAAYKDGEDVDPESASGAGHLDALAANLAILLDAREHGTLVDDRHKGPAAKMIRRENDGYKRRAAPDPGGGPARDKEEDDLIALLAEARNAAWQVHRGEKTSVTLRPMTRRERRIVHSVVQGHPELTTKSYGEGDHRRVTITRAGKHVAGPASTLPPRKW